MIKRTVDLGGPWVRAHEEDGPQTQAYRPRAWPLPRSRRPRGVLEFGPDGVFVSRAGGPADARVTREGRWRAQSEQPLILRLEWPDAPQETVVEVVTCSEELLALRLISGSLE